MNARFFLVAGGCGAAALVIAGFGAAVGLGGAPETSAQAPVVTPRHGHFETRLQPVLDGIGSTRDLPPVQLGGGAAPLPSTCGRDASAANCHGHAGARP